MTDRKISVDENVHSTSICKANRESGNIDTPIFNEPCQYWV
jgi:hypothetical protein